MYFIFLLIFGLIILGLVINVVFDEWGKEHRNKLMLGLGIFFSGVTLCFVLSTIFLTAKYGRMADYILATQF